MGEGLREVEVREMGIRSILELAHTTNGHRPRRSGNYTGVPGFYYGVTRAQMETREMFKQKQGDLELF